MTQYFTIFGMAVFIILAVSIIVRAIRWILWVNWENACNARFRDKMITRVTKLEGPGMMAEKR